MFNRFCLQFSYREATCTLYRMNGLHRKSINKPIKLYTTSFKFVAEQHFFGVLLFGVFVAGLLFFLSASFIFIACGISSTLLSDQLTVILVFQLPSCVLACFKIWSFGNDDISQVF